MVQYSLTRIGVLDMFVVWLIEMGPLQCYGQQSLVIGSCLVTLARGVGREPQISEIPLKRGVPWHIGMSGTSEPGD